MPVPWQSPWAFGVKELDKAIKVKVHEAGTSFFRSHGLPRTTRLLTQAGLGPLYLGHVRVECLDRHFPSRIPASLSRRRSAGLPADWRPRASVQAISACRFLGPGRPGQRIAVIRSRCGARPGDAAFVTLAMVTATSGTVHAVQGTSSCSSGRQPVASQTAPLLFMREKRLTRARGRTQ